MMRKIKISIPRETQFLILDDMLSFREANVEHLNKLGFNGKYALAENLAEARALAKKLDVQFFLCDWNLPDGTGLDFLKEIKYWIIHFLFEFSWLTDLK